ncbi:MAG: TolC family protein [Candidatus Acidiferrales bacterium]
MKSYWKIILVLACVGTITILSPAIRAQESAAQGNPAQAATPAVTLDQLEQMAAAGNPTLKQASAGVRAAAGKSRQAGLWPNPTVGYAGEEIRGGSFGGGQHGFFIQQDIVLGGKLGLSQKIFQAEGKQAEAEVEEQRMRVENGVRVAFYRTLAAQELVEVCRELRDEAQQAVKTSDLLANVGQSDEPDLLEAQVEADNADLALVTAEQKWQRDWRILAAVVGRPEMPLTLLEGSLESPPDLNLAEMLEKILTESPAVKISQLGLERAQASLTREKRENVPDLTLRAGYMNNREAIDPAGHAVGGEAFVEAGVHLRIFDRNQGNIETVDANLERARLEVDRVKLGLRQQAAPFFQNYATARATVERYRAQTLPNAKRAYELYLHKYHEGAAAYPQVLIAQRTFFQLQASYIAALRDLWTNAAAIQGLLLTDGLELSASAPGMDRPMPGMIMQAQEFQASDGR